MRDFFGCYLLLSLAPEAKGRTYIGFTVNPRRRIRQHNGQIKAGAWKTSRGRPWDMTLVLYGFPTKIQALQFEWAWQHPLRSVIVRPIAQALGSKKLKGVRGQILLMLSMLHESPWRYFPLTLQYLDPKYASMVKETMLSAPGHIRVFTAPMDHLPHSLDDLDDDEDEGEDDDDDDDGDEDDHHTDSDKEQPRDQEVLENEEELLEFGHGDGSVRGGKDGAHREGQPQCSIGPAVAPIIAKAAKSVGNGSSNSRLPCHICQGVIQRHILVCSACGVAFHLDCLAARWSATGDGGAGHRFGGVPEQGHCPACNALHSWMAMLRSMQTIGWGNKPRGRRGRKARKAPLAGEVRTDTHPSQGTTEEAGAEVGAVPGRKACKRASKPKALSKHTMPGIQESDDGAGPLFHQMPVGVYSDEVQQQLLSQVEEQVLGEAAILRRKPRGRAGGHTAKTRRPVLGSEGAIIVGQSTIDGTGNPLTLPAKVQGATIKEPGVTVAGPRRAPRGVKASSKKQPLLSQPGKPAKPPAAPEAVVCAGHDLGRGAGDHDDAEEVRAVPTQSIEFLHKQPHRARQLDEARSPQRQGADKLPADFFSMPRFSAQLADASIGHGGYTAELSPLPLWQRLRVRAVPTSVDGANHPSVQSRLGCVEGAARKGIGPPMPDSKAAGPSSQRVMVLTSDSSSASSAAEVSPLKRTRSSDGKEVDVARSEVLQTQGGRTHEVGSLGCASLRLGRGSNAREAAAPCTVEHQQPRGMADGRIQRRPQQEQEQDHEQQQPRQQPLGEVESPPSCFPSLEEPLPDVVILGTTTEDTEEEPGPLEGSPLDSMHVERCPSLLAQERQTCVTPLAVAHNKSPMVIDPGSHPPASPPRYMDSPPLQLGGVMEVEAIPSLDAPPGNATAFGLAATDIDSTGLGSIVLNNLGSGTCSQDCWGSGQCSAVGSRGSSLEVLHSQLQCPKSTSSEPKEQAGAVTAGLCSGNAETSVPLCTEIAEAACGLGIPVPPDDTGEKVPAVKEVVDLCTPLPLRSRLARRAAISQATTAAVCPGMPWAAMHSENIAGKRLRSPKLPTGGRTTLGGSIGGSDTNGCLSAGLPGRTHQSADRVASDAVAPGATLPADYEPKAPLPVIEKRNGSSAYAPGLLHGESASGGWSVSPWPLRQKRRSPEAAVNNEANLGASGRLGDSDEGLERRLDACQKFHHVGNQSVTGDDVGRLEGNNGLLLGMTSKGQERDPEDLEAGRGTRGLARFNYEDIGSDDDVIVLDCS